ncbi:hypothetical protein CW702_02355 [Candidatus Bathyarchaeota archaeon]|nr:MAG: hypothetical protein CW702_02355 [Candidatus Bathyarchaeota archaeon]
MMDSVKLSGFIVLFIGVAVLLFTFYHAYLLLQGVLEIPTSENLMALFGDALAPLISYSIRALYLGIMGWIGSILTRRGVQTITYERELKKLEGHEVQVSMRKLETEEQKEEKTKSKK